MDILNFERNGQIVSEHETQARAAYFLNHWIGDMKDEEQFEWLKKRKTGLLKKDSRKTFEIFEDHFKRVDKVDFIWEVNDLISDLYLHLKEKLYN